MKCCGDGVTCTENMLSVYPIFSSLSALKSRYIGNFLLKFFQLLLVSNSMIDMTKFREKVVGEGSFSLIH